MKQLFTAAVFLLTAMLAQAQVSTFPTNGAPNPNHNFTAFTNARIIVDAETVIDKGTLLIRDGFIVDAGPAVTIPAGTVVIDLQGKWIYPSFIDPYTTYGITRPKRAPHDPAPQYETARPGAYAWNDALKPDNDAYRHYTANAETAEAYRNLGFGTVMSYYPDGIARGTATCVTLNAEQGDNRSMLQDKVAACYSFNKGTSTQEYPGSLMGAIALMRQTYADAAWYNTLKAKTEYNHSLDAWIAIQTLPQIFETTDKWNVLRADKVGDEFGVQYIFKGSGNEYQRMDEMKATGASFILPLNFPAAFDVDDPFDARMIAYEDLKHWELAPLNPGAFEKYGIRFALTASDLEDKAEFMTNLRRAILFGLSEKMALRALTTIPAEMLGIADKAGTLRKGMLANFIITSGNVFAENTVIWENWVRGQKYVINDMSKIDIRGSYQLTVGNDAVRNLKITGSLMKMKGAIQNADSSKTPAMIDLAGNAITLVFTPKGVEGAYRLSGSVDAVTKSMTGSAQLPDGKWMNWTAKFTAAHEEKPQTPDTTNWYLPTLDDVIYPFASYGVTRNDTSMIDRLKRRYDAVLIKNVTVWTGAQGDTAMPDMDVYITEGRIVRIAKNIDAPKGAFALVIDGTGKHLTPGIIDEHSHIAVAGGVNEGTQASTAEVRIGDVINPDDVNIYRQLSGGVTAAQLLHGSANPIGGQSALVKLRWGSNAEQMKIAGAMGFIKFALGENVKQANWGEYFTIRFPQSRMGVEQVYFDHFTRAKEYQRQWEEWKKLSPKDREKMTPPRRDLEMETLVEILTQARFITCHSYVQSEINMLMQVADSMGFKVNTFTHILEGYKVADKMRKHGAGGSSFADWWAYKMEVMDAIPQNPAILFRMGIVVAVNSDDAEMARRLNQEAAKSIKYGDLTEEEALMMVTSNPAKLLHLDKHQGTIAVGMDADVVLWSDNPLSVYAKVEKTLIDGKVLYDSEEDARRRETMEKERARIIQKMMHEKENGAPTVKPRMKRMKVWDCEDLGTENDYLNDAE
ncbi:MAG: amidohydrolase family protein [Bacteroidia bacterium]|jgi:imidazolonepropionase-like amidohydrolase|nr:amidohydrolase family protein [Bacteroidia bacterium]